MSSFGLSMRSIYNRPITHSFKKFGTFIPVILTTDIQNKGAKGDVIEVKRGFARNYLIPRNFAGKIYDNQF